MADKHHAWLVRSWPLTHNNIIDLEVPSASEVNLMAHKTPVDNDTNHRTRHQEPLQIYSTNHSINRFIKRTKWINTRCRNPSIITPFFLWCAPFYIYHSQPPMVQLLPWQCSHHLPTSFYSTVPYHCNEQLSLIIETVITNCPWKNLVWKMKWIATREVMQEPCQK